MSKKTLKKSCKTQKNPYTTITKQGYIYIKPIENMKTISRPLTDINGRDFMTGKFVPSEPVPQMEGLKQKAEKFIIQKDIEAKKAGRTDGKIFVDGLGWVNK